MIMFNMFDRVKTRVDKVVKGEGPVGRMWEAWDEKKLGSQKNKHTNIRSRKTTPGFPKRMDLVRKQGVRKREN